MIAELKESFNVECGELETKTESISEEVADIPKASNRSTITADIEDDMGTEVPDELVLHNKDLPIAIDIEDDAVVKSFDAESDSRKSSESSTLKQSDTSAASNSGGGLRRSSEPKKYFPLPSSTSDDNESISKSLAEPIMYGQSTESSSEQQQTKQQQVFTSNLNAEKDVFRDDENEMNTATYSTTACAATFTPPSEVVSCELCVCGVPSAPPPIERLLPIGGELSETVRHSLSRRPYPSMMNPSVSVAPSAATTGPTGCCCCYQQSISGCPVSSCCTHYQQTIEAYKKQHAAATRELSRERLLPIGPKPQVNQTSSSSHSRPSSSQHHYSHSSASVERKVPDRCKSGKAGAKLLIRQHTTIGPDEQNHRRHRGSHSSGNTVIRGVLLSSKSMDSVPDNFKTKFDRNSHKVQQQQQSNMAAASALTNSDFSSTIAGGENVTSNTVETTFGTSSSQPNIRTIRKSISHNSEESICTPVKEHLPSFSKAKTNTFTACNGNLDETATESEQELSKSIKDPSKSKTSFGSESTIINGIENEKQTGEKGKKRAKKKSKKNKSSKSMPTSMTNTPSHHQKQTNSPTTVINSAMGTGSGGAESPVAVVGDNEVFTGNQANTSDFVGKSKTVQSQPDSAKDTTSGRSNEASSSSNTDLTSNAFEMCTICGMPIEKFDEQELGLCLVSL